MYNKSLICFTLFCLIFSEFKVNICHGTKIEHKSKSYDVTKFAIVHPKLRHAKNNTLLERTRQENGLHVDLLSLSYIYNSNEVIIDLQLNNNLIPLGHFLRYQSVDGKKIVKNLTKAEIDMCHYHGTIRGSRNSHVALSTCNGINGFILDDYDEYHIHSGPEHKINCDHFLYRVADTPGNHTKDGGNGGKLRYKRSAKSNNTMRGPYNSNKNSSYIELVIVVDNEFYTSQGSNLTKVYAYTTELANILYSLYVPLNIFISLVGVVVWNYKNEIEISENIDGTLSSFAYYRRVYLIQDHPNDNAQLLTTFKFGGSLIGKSYIKQICTTYYSVGVTRRNTYLVGEVAATMAHEIGHNLGMEHDTDLCECVEESCIMSARESPKIVQRHWSSCSTEQLNSSFKQGMNHCLKNKPTKLFQPQSCGNGFIEIGEQCDCGLPEICDNRCCNPETCMLRANASCATGKCCDLSTCQIRKIEYECRVADGECDLAEYCNGNSEYCPNDIFKRDTESCGNGEAYCYNGLCQTHTNQCKLLWGSPGKSMKPCFVGNTDGSAFGNCGSNILFHRFTPCDKDDILCGLVHCKSFHGELQYGNGIDGFVRETEIMVNRSTISCKTAIVDFGIDTKNPGLAPDGAKCGDSKMCLNQKCVSLEYLRRNGIGVCPEDCNGNGICDSLGQCRCSIGFDPPTCKNPFGEVSICPENCNGNGECTNEGHCHCFWGFNPPSCRNATKKIPACPEDCNGNGQCNNESYCDCFSEYLPPTCKNLIENTTESNKSENSNAPWFIGVIAFIVIALLILLSVFVQCRKRPFVRNGQIPYKVANI